MEKNVYKAVKNLVMNEMKISREEIIEVIRDEVRKTLVKEIQGTFGKNIEYIMTKAFYDHFLGDCNYNARHKFKQILVDKAKEIASEKMEVIVRFKEEEK